MRYCDYNYYKEVYGGNMPESSFNRLSLEASAYIKRNTRNRVDENNIPDEVKLCTCSLCDKLRKIEKSEGKKSETVGSWSVTYEEKSENNNDLYDILLNYLSESVTEEGIPLLYRGC